MEDREESLINDWELQRGDFLGRKRQKGNCKFRSKGVHRTTEKIMKGIIKENSSGKDSISLPLLPARFFQGTVGKEMLSHLEIR